MPDTTASDAEPIDLKTALVELRHAREEIARLRPFVDMVDQTTLRDQIAERLAAQFTSNGEPTQGMRVITDDDDGLPAARRVRPLEAADAVLAVLFPQQPDEEA